VQLINDYESRVIGITYPLLATNSFTYNGLDTRTSKTDSGGTKGFLRDGASVTDPVLSDGAATYTPGISESRSGVSTFYGQDQLGSVTLQTNSSSSITYKASYDAFGAIKSSTGSTSSPFGFAGGPGYQQDSDSGLMLLGHRYYDSSTGRFLTRDPVKDGSNWYDYVGNNPVRAVDPCGCVQMPPVVSPHQCPPPSTAIPFAVPGSVWGGIGEGGGTESGKEGVVPWKFGAETGMDGLTDGVAGVTDTDVLGGVEGTGTTIAAGLVVLGDGLVQIVYYKKRIEAAKKEALKS